MNIYSNQISLTDKDQNYTHCELRPGAKSAIYDCLAWFNILHNVLSFVVDARDVTRLLLLRPASGAKY